MITRFFLAPLFAGLAKLLRAAAVEGQQLLLQCANKNRYMMDVPLLRIIKLRGGITDGSIVR